MNKRDTVTGKWYVELTLLARDALAFTNEDEETSWVIDDVDDDGRGWRYNECRLRRQVVVNKDTVRLEFNYSFRMELLG